MESVDFSLYYQRTESRAATGHSEFRIGFVELVIELIKSFSHKHLHHLVKIACFVKQLSPLSYLTYQILLDVLHALRASMSI